MPPTPSCLGDRKTYLNFVISHEAIVYVSPGPPLTSQPGPVSTHERQPLKIYSQIPILPASSFSFEAGEGIASSLPLSRQTAGWERCKVGTGREFVMSSTTVSGKCQGHPPNQNQRYPRPFLCPFWKLRACRGQLHLDFQPYNLWHGVTSKRPRSRQLGPIPRESTRSLIRVKRRGGFRILGPLPHERPSCPRDIHYPLCFLREGPAALWPANLSWALGTVPRPRQSPQPRYS